MTTSTAPVRTPRRSPAAPSPPRRTPQLRPAARRGPDTSQRATIFLIVLGITILVSVLAQLAWAVALSQGLVAASVGSLVAANLCFGTMRVLLGAGLSMTAMRRAFGCRPTWPVALRAHLVGVLVSKAAMLGPPPAVVTLLLCAGLALPAWTFMRRAG